MTKYEVVEVIRSCQPIYKNLYDKITHQLTPVEKALFEQFKIIWDDDSLD